MILYHGTSKANALKIMEEGIKPRSENPGNWNENPSIEDHVYLTKGYAAYFAGQVADESDDQWALIEIETDNIGDLLLYPDEDFLEQSTRSISDEFIEREGLKNIFYDYPTEPLPLEERTQWFRDRIERFSNFWHASLESLGTCSVKGPVPPEAITRVAFYDKSSNPLITMSSLDPTITILNWRICRTKYLSLTDWFFGGSGEFLFDLDAAQMKEFQMSDEARKTFEMIEEQQAEAREMLKNRSGLEVVNCR